MNALSTASDAWRNKLLEWDGFLTRESTEATLYGTWLRLFSAAVTKGANVTVTDRLNAVLLRDALNNGHRFCGGSCETQHAQAFEDAIIELGLTADTNRGVKYGDVHHFSIQSQVFEGTLVECFFARECVAR
jgi:acyl-homoserine lactone acylase PvdQ